MLIEPSTADTSDSTNSAKLKSTEKSQTEYYLRFKVVDNLLVRVLCILYISSYNSILQNMHLSFTLKFCTY